MVMTPPTPIILASQSLQRKKLLEAAGIDFTIQPANIDEKSFRNPDLIKRAAEIARKKAETVALENPSAIIIAADSFLTNQGKTYEKPHTIKEAEQMLSTFSGKRVQVITGVCYLDPKLSLMYTDTVVSWAQFRSLSDHEVERYTQTQPVTTWSGGFSPAYDAGAALLTEISGSLTGCTHGLPMEIILPLLEKSLTAKNESP